MLNAAFIIITIRKQELQKEYAWFLIGVAGANLMYCLNNAIPQVIIVVMDVEPTSTFCQVVGVVLLTNGVGAVCIQPLLALNRFVALYHSHLTAKIFTRRNNALMLAGTFLSCMCVSIGLVYLGDMGRLGNTMCGPQIETMAITHVCLFVAPMFVAYGICIFCGYKILYLIRSHQSEARRRELGSRLQDAKDIFRLIILELAVPISIEMPVLILCMISSYIYVPLVVIAFAFGLFITHPVLDPIVIVFVMKPYRNYIQSVWRSYRGTSVEPTSVTNVSAGGKKF